MAESGRREFIVTLAAWGLVANMAGVVRLGFVPPFTSSGAALLREPRLWRSWLRGEG